MKNFKYTIEIIDTGINGCGEYNQESKTLETRKFDTLKEARKEIRKMCKKEGFKKLGYTYWNQENGTELYMNF